MKEQLKPDFIVWTGDNSPHEEDLSRKERITYTLNETSRMIKEAFFDNGIPVFATYGNHDVFPNAQFDFNTGNGAIQDGI